MFLLDQLPQTIFAVFLVFARVGGMMMVIPGIGEAAVSPRIRLIFSLLLAYVLANTMMARVPPLPDNSWMLLALIGPELLIGLMMGTIIRMAMSALSTAGEIAAMTTSLSFAQMANPMNGMGGSAIGVLMTTMGMVIIFTANIHHVFLNALADSYGLFPMGRMPSISDASDLTLATVSSSFRLGLQLAAPFVVLSLIINISLGLANRVMPQFQVFFISAPASILLGFTVLSTIIGIMLTTWAGHIEAIARSYGGA